MVGSKLKPNPTKPKTLNPTLNPKPSTPTPVVNRCLALRLMLRELWPIVGIASPVDHPGLLTSLGVLCKVYGFEVLGLVQGLRRGGGVV